MGSAPLSEVARDAIDLWLSQSGKKAYVLDRYGKVRVKRLTPADRKWLQGR